MVKENFLHGKKGNILTENLIFIILNLAFLSILVIFLFTKMSGAAVLEEKYAKQIALLIDSAEEGMTIEVDMEDAIKEAQDNNLGLESVVGIEGNIVTVKLRDDGGYSYAFFSDFNFDGISSNYYRAQNSFVFAIGK